jgi:endonuclease/exonuclease/phosphatase family metal-dependent hydrolase
VLGVGVVGLRCACGRERAGQMRFATFNIENFPKDARQVDGAFAEMKALDATFIGVQEIGDPDRFLREAERRLGDRWQFAHVDSRPIGETRPGHHIGVLFDSRRWTLVTMRVHDATRLERGRHKPVLDVRLRSGDTTVTVLVVHLKSGGDAHEIRARQLVALASVVAEVQRRGDRVVLLGDFNATGSSDRTDLAQLATRTGLTWASEPLACTAFWDRDDGCPRSQLDHVLMWARPRSIRAAGACATHGCDWEPSCPIYADHVSDHCPVVVTAE